nr:reverse transcriptase domain-containing protein [Tanacetum cinerariifolium]
VQNQLANLTDMLSKFMSSNTASSSGSEGLPGNTVTNPKEDLKGVTTRSGVAYQGPTTAPSKQKTEVTKDQVQNPSSQSTAPVQPLVAQSEEPVSTSKQANTLVSASKPNPQASIPYPSRRNDERNQEKAKDQIKKLYQIFKDMRMAECLALADLGASINLMPYSVWKKLSLPDLTPTCMTQELADRSISRPVGVAEDVYV